MYDMIKKIDTEITKSEILIVLIFFKYKKTIADAVSTKTVPLLVARTANRGVIPKRLTISLLLR